MTQSSRLAGSDECDTASQVVVHRMTLSSRLVTNVISAIEQDIANRMEPYALYRISDVGFDKL